VVQEALETRAARAAQLLRGPLAQVDLAQETLVARAAQADSSQSARMGRTPRLSQGGPVVRVSLLARMVHTDQADQADQPVLEPILLLAKL
jgi:hypothetical protein